jgi:hypothetical protein
MRGMKRIAETPGLCDIKVSPLSIYLHSGDDHAVRFHRKGQDLSGKQSSTGDHHPLCFMAFELSTQAPGNVELDLSVYCDEDASVPSGDQSKKGNKGTKRKRKRTETEANLVEPYQVHKPTKELTTLGRFKQELEIQDPAPGQVYTVYVFVELQRFWADVYAVHTKSGDAVPKLEGEIIDNVIFKGKLRESWTKVGEDQVFLVALGQVVRSETFGASSLGDFSREAVHTVQSDNGGNADDTVAKPPAKRARCKASISRNTVVDESDFD